MTELEEYYAEKDREFWSDDEEEDNGFSADPIDTLEWLAEFDMPEPVGDLLEMMGDALKENPKSSVNVLLANFLDKYEAEIKEYVNR